MSQPSEQPKLEAAQNCPLCKGANQCAVIVGKGIEDCWCAQQVFPPLAVLQAQASDSLQGAISPILPSADACILCKGANQCAVIVGKGIEDCWCAQQVFPPLAVLQAQASDSLQGAISPILPSADACICQTCLSQLKQSLSQGQITTQDEKSPSSVSDGLGYEVK